MKYYWIDPSCDVDYILFDTYNCEARALARRALERLQSPTDTDFARVFNVLFKTPKTATEKKYPFPKHYYRLNNMADLPEDWKIYKSIPEHVMDTLSDFATDWERTKDRKIADARIYNDSGARLAFDRAADRWYDPVNHVFSRGDPANEIARGVSAVTAGECRSWTGPNDDENPKRSVIDIYPFSWEAKKENTPLSMKSLREAINHLGKPSEPKILEVFTDDRYQLMTSTVAHEFMHVHAYDFTDGSSTYKPAGTAPTGGWKFVMSERKAWECAEAMVILMMAAGLADMRPFGETKGGYTLDRAWDLIPGENEPENTWIKWAYWTPGNNAAKGYFKYYPDMTDEYQGDKSESLLGNICTWQ